MESELIWAPIVVAAYFALPTFLVYSTQVFRADGIGELIAEEKKVPRSVREPMSSIRAVLKELGFESRGVLVVSGISANAAALAEVLVNPQSKDMALVAFAYGYLNGMVTDQVRYVEFIRYFRDGDAALLQTSNNGRPGAFVDDPNHRIFRLPSVQSLPALFDCHLQLLDLYATGLQSFVRLDEEFGGDPAVFVDQITRECLERQTTMGLMKYDQTRNLWQPTLWGAFRLSAQELPPFKQLRAMRLISRGKRILGELRR